MSLVKNYTTETNLFEEKERVEEMKGLEIHFKSVEAVGYIFYYVFTYNKNIINFQKTPSVCMLRVFFLY